MRRVLPHLGRLWLPCWILAVTACTDVTGSRPDSVDGPHGVVSEADGASAGSLSGIWVGPEEIAARPTAGAAWDRVLTDAARTPAAPMISDGGSQHDVYTLAAALACARTGQYCDKARAQLLEAIGTEAGAEWQSVARNLGAYVIAADVLGLRDDGDPASDGSRVQAWIASFLTRTDIIANLGEPGLPGPRMIAPFHSGSNGAAQEGFVHAAVAAYVGDTAALSRSWDAFRTYACEPGAPDREHIDLSKGIESYWAHSETAPCAVNPLGTTKLVPEGQVGAGGVHRIDGAIINDMRRGGPYQWPPGWSQYPWVGLEGFVPAAVILQRAGYPAFEVADRAVLRTVQYLKFLEDSTPPDTVHWFDGIRGAEVVQIVNWYYGTSFPMNKAAVGAARTIGYSDWTHPAVAAPGLPPSASAGGPYEGTEGAPVRFDGSASTDPDGNLPLAYAWSFGDGATGSGVQPSHAYADEGSYTVTLIVQDATGATSTSATTTAAILNVAPTVDAGPDRTIAVDDTARVTLQVSDPGTGDAPWSWIATWGDGTRDSSATSSLDSGITASHRYAAAGTYFTVIDVFDGDGGQGVDTIGFTVVPPAETPSVLVGAGDIATCSGNNDAATAALIDAIPGVVMTLGDNAYKSGTAAEYANCYGPTWGRHLSRTRPAPGERDYVTAGAAGYFGYFGAVAGMPGTGYYSYDVGSWHVVVLNTEIAVSASSAQYAWLAADLAAHPSQCALAYWHRPYRSSGYGTRTNLRPVWELLLQHGVDVVVSAHDRYYERFAPVDPDGVPSPSGIREFIVGTGGAARSSAPKTRLSGSEVLESGTPGVLELTLGAGSYGWEFIPVAGKSFTDQGSGTCGG